MGKMNIVLNDDLERRFREAVFKTKGMKKGNISQALEEAIKSWIQQVEPQKPQLNSVTSP